MDSVLKTNIPVYKRYLIIMAIEWDYSTPRTGVYGYFDRFFGPGMTKGEILVNIAGLLALSLLILVPLYMSGIEWSLLQWALAAFIALDICGGALTLAMSPAKRWYHRSGMTVLSHLKFVSLHIHPFLIVFFFGGDWIWAAIVYGLVILSAVLVLHAPLYLQRPGSVFFIAVSVLLQGIIASPAGFFWFAPLFFVKLIGGHCTREEPYRP